MRDLSIEELGHVYGAGGRGCSPCPPSTPRGGSKGKSKGKSKSKGKGKRKGRSGSRGKGYGSC